MPCMGELAVAGKCKKRNCDHCMTMKKWCVLVGASVEMKHRSEGLGNNPEEGQHKKAKVEVMINDEQEGIMVKSIPGSRV